MNFLLPSHLQAFLSMEPECPFPRASDPIEHTPGPCLCCAGSGQLMAHHPEYSSVEVECWACGGSGESMLAFDEEQAYINNLLWELEELGLEIPADEMEEAA